MRLANHEFSKKDDDPSLVRFLCHCRREPTKPIRTATVIMLFSLFSGLWSFRLGTIMASSSQTSNDGSLNFEQPNEMADSLLLVKNATTITPTTSPTPNSSDVLIGYKVDIVSIGSNTRPEYLTTQRETWGSYPLIRNFFLATEADDIDPACQSQPRNLTVQWQDFCSATYKYNKTASPPQNTTDIMHWYASSLFPAEKLDKKPNPVGYLCAQVRFPLVLAKTVMGYLQRREEFPDYLIMVDDDSYYNMDLFYKEIMEGKDSSKPLVTAGCSISFHNQRSKPYNTIPFGGFGLTFSKGSLERFTRPILQEPKDDWEAMVHRQLEQNLIFERPSFEYGMSLIELMDAFTKLEKLSEIAKWTRGFCFHGDWIPALFVTLYNIGGIGPYLDVIGDSTGPRKGNCRNKGDACNATTSLACHYQTPDHLRFMAAEQQRLLL